MDDAHVDDDNSFHERKNNSIGLDQPRSEHSCKEYNLLGARGLLIAGGFSKASDSDTPTTLGTMEYFFGYLWRSLRYGKHFPICSNLGQGLD